MANQNDFLPLAIGAGNNTMAQADYAAAFAAGFGAVGFVAGIAQSAQLNKVWRQSSVIASVVAQFISDTLGEDVLDNGNTAALLDQLNRAIGIAAATQGALLVTDSAALALTRKQVKVGLSRSVAPAAQVITLAPNAGLVAGFSQKISDLFGNANAFPVTVQPSAGTISGQPNFVMNEDKQIAEFTYYGANVWGVES